MNLEDILNEIEVLEINGERDIVISNISLDSRTVASSQIYICNSKFSRPYSYIEMAISHGASCVISEFTYEDLEKNSKKINCSECTFVAVKSISEIIFKLAANFYETDLSKLKFIGVTGTNGKTSTTYFARHIIDSLGHKTALIGTTGYLIEDKLTELNNTTPDSLILTKIFKEMINKKIEYVVMEVSSHALSLGRIGKLDFEVAAFTNLTQDHLDFHGSMQNYLNSKMLLFEMTKKAVINGDDEYAEHINFITTNKLTYGFKASNDISVSDIVSNISKTKFKLKENADGKLQTFQISSNIIGKFNLYNLLCSVSITRSLGFELENIVSTLKKMPQVKGRMELVPNLHQKNIIIDYAHTPDALEKLIKSAREITNGKLITIFGCGGDRDKTKRPLMGKIAILLSDFCIITSDNPRTEDPVQIIKDIIFGNEEYLDKFMVIENRKEAIRCGIDIIGKGTLLIAGKGHETYQILKNGKIDFDERKIIWEITRNNYGSKGI